MDIRAFKLTSGEEIIAGYVGHVAPSATAYGKIIVNRPRVINVQQVQPGQFGLALAPWMLSIGGNDSGPDGEIALASQTVMTPSGVPVPAAIEKEYLKMTSGIQLV